MLFQKYSKELTERRKVKEENLKLFDSSYKIIPKFFHTLPKNTESLALKLREEARALFLQKRSKELLDRNELKTIWRLLEKHQTHSVAGDDQYITYDDYLKVAEQAGERCKIYLTASVFARILSISPCSGRASIMSLFNYTMKKVWLQQTRISMSLYDFTGQGYLRELVIFIVFVFEWIFFYL